MTGNLAVTRKRRADSGFRCESAGGGKVSIVTCSCVFDLALLGKTHCHLLYGRVVTRVSHNGLGSGLFYHVLRLGTRRLEGLATQVSFRLCESASRDYGTLGSGIPLEIP